MIKVRITVAGHTWLWEIDPFHRQDLHVYADILDRLAMIKGVEEDGQEIVLPTDLGGRAQRMADEEMERCRKER